MPSSQADNCAMFRPALAISPGCAKRAPSRRVYPPMATQTPPGHRLLPQWPMAASLCEVHRDFIQAQLLLRRNATAIYQDLVDAHGFTAAYNSVKRFVRNLRKKAPE